MIYFYIPVTLCVLLNLGLYVVTVVRLSMHNRQTRIVRQSRRSEYQPASQPTLNFLISRLNAGTGNDESVFGKDAMEELVNTGDISYNHLSSGTVINHLDFVYETLLSPRNYLDILLSPLPFTWKSQKYQLSGLF